jgi:hypothetical protein
MLTEPFPQEDEFISPISFERCEIRMRLLLEEYRLRVLQQSSDHLVFSAEAGWSWRVIAVNGTLLQQGTDTRVRLYFTVGTLAKLFMQIPLERSALAATVLAIALLWWVYSPSTYPPIVAFIVWFFIMSNMIVGRFQTTETLNRFTLFLREAFLPSDRVHIEERKGNDQKEKR